MVLHAPFGIWKNKSGGALLPGEAPSLYACILSK
jgi:hypothetical protein